MSEYQGPPSGESGSGRNQSAAGWPPGGGNGPGDSGDTAAPGTQTAEPPPKALRRGRPGLVALYAVLAEIVIVAALENQGLYRHIFSFSQSHRSQFVGQAAFASLTYSWRFTPPSDDTGRMWLGQTLGLVSIFVITLLLMLTVVRGSITFGRALFGTWMSVIVATGLGGMVAQAIFTGRSGPPGVDRVSGAVFYGTDGFAFAASVGLGFVVGLIAALVAVVTRRQADPVAAGPTPVAATPQNSTFFEGQPRGLAEPGPSREDADRPSMQKGNAADRPTSVPQQPSGQSQTTAELPVADEGGRQTTQLPRLGVGGSSGSDYSYGQQGSPPQSYGRPPAETTSGDASTAEPSRSEPSSADPSRSEPSSADESSPHASAQETTELPTTDASTDPSADRPAGDPASSDRADDQPDTWRPSTAEQGTSRETTQLPRVGEPGQARQFPRPPDDEDLGHMPD